MGDDKAAGSAWVRGGCGQVRQSAIGEMLHTSAHRGPTTIWKYKRSWHCDRMMVAFSRLVVDWDSDMAGKTKRTQQTETPSERFERVAKKALERGRRAREKREQVDRETEVMNSQASLIQRA